MGTTALTVWLSRRGRFADWAGKDLTVAADAALVGYVRGQKWMGDSF